MQVNEFCFVKYPTQRPVTRYLNAFRTQTEDTHNLLRGQDRPYAQQSSEKKRSSRAEYSEAAFHSSRTPLPSNPLLKMLRAAEVSIQNATTRARESLKADSTPVRVVLDSVQVSVLPLDKCSGFYVAVCIKDSTERYVANPHSPLPGSFHPSPNDFVLSAARDE